MNTKNVYIMLPVGVALGGLALLVLGEKTNYLPVLAAIVSYAAVAGLVALAANDYKARRN